MSALTKLQRETLQRIAAKLEGIPEAAFSFSGARGKTINALKKLGYIKGQPEDLSRGGWHYRLVATDAGRAALADLAARRR